MYLLSMLLAVGAVFLTAAILRGRFSYKGKTVLITGGSRGLGLELAREVLKKGGRVSICARDFDELKAAEKELLRFGSEVDVRKCDITRQDEVELMVMSVEEDFGPVDVLINNAGVIQAGPAEEMTLDDYDRMMKTHFWAPLYAVFALLPRMERRGGGRIVNIASVGGKISAPHILPYGASKFALVGFSEGLAAEVRKHKVYVTTVCPGLMRTGSALNAEFKGRHREEFAWFNNADSMPFLSIDSAKAARKILAACAKKKTEIILTVPAKLGVWFHGLFPGTTIRILSYMNRKLPAAGGIGKQSLKGKESLSAASQNKITRRNEEAALRNNEISKEELKEAKRRQSAA